MDKYYVTTPIYYVNAKPHIGTAYTTLAADSLARWNRLLKKRVVFLTGTDEHGQKVQQCAKDANISPKDFVDKVSTQFKTEWGKLKLSYDRFIRTTDSDHIEVSKAITKKCFDNGDIYLGKYSGWYSVQDETFFKEDELVDGKAPSSHAVKWLEEEVYFFKLSKYQDQLLEYYENNPEFISPQYRAQEFINRVKGGLKDLCVSRTSFDWGIPFEVNGKSTNHVTYVWFDALTNYLSGIGYLNNKEMFDQMWPADVQIVGKDIGWFHVVIWPAMLMSAGIELPKKVYIHGFITVHGDKMSKSKGNVKNPDELTKLGIDIFRYYLLRYIPFGQDGDFLEVDYYTKLNTDLANDLGNLISRTNAMIKKYLDGKLTSYTHDSFESDLEKCDEGLQELTNEVINSSKIFDKFNDQFQNLYFHNAFSLLWEFIAVVNKYVNDSRPWDRAKENKTIEIKVIMETLVESIRIINNYISPVLIDTNKKLELIFNIETDNKFDFLIDHEDIEIIDSGIIFQKFDLKEFLKKQDEENEKNQKKEIDTIPPFEKLDLRIAHIENVFNHPDADKLYIIHLDLGALGKRQIVAGMKEHYSKEELEGQNIVLLANLKPKKLRGQTSHGMMLACENGDVIGFLSADAVPGTKIVLEDGEKDVSDINEFKKPEIEYSDFEKVNLIAKDGKVYFKDDKEHLLLTFNKADVLIIGTDKGKIC